MASSSISAAVAFPFLPSSLSRLRYLCGSSPPLVGCSDHVVRTHHRKNSVLSHQRASRLFSPSIVTHVSGSLFEGGFGGEENLPTPPRLTAIAEDREEPQCPPGLRRYESMVVLRPDMSEDDRLKLTQKYEELLVAGGGMYVEVFNRGVIPLAYSISKRNRAGEKNVYFDGIYLLFTYFTKPDSIANLEATLKTDENVIRSSTFKVRKRKHT